ncbi:MAG: beta-N-acetylhexosaminidase [Verrucomicrobia bacterium]|nr:beta-N-acetylhexosaminidase [Verrucomicrobiota bacterium]MBS0646036.1 beta-N-acetylhexosaminidase [Verrucomicrobiota bacterium]
MSSSKSLTQLDENSLLRSMTIEEKVGQLLMVHFHGKMANQDSKQLIQNLKVGGIIYYTWANELSCPHQVQNLSLGLQKQTHKNRLNIPLLIAVDQEGGVVSRLQYGFTDFPGNWAIGRTNNPLLAQQSAYALGQELKAVGINMNLAPVIDINTSSHHPIIGIRSFGSDPYTVSLFADYTLRGYQQAQMIATLKHFPGHGDACIDSHCHLPSLQKSQKELESTDLLPFKKLAQDVEVIMTAHLLVPALDPKRCSTLSEPTLTYLRENLNFQGVILSDSLSMQAIAESCPSFEEAAIQALQAGCDMLLLGGKSLLESHSMLEFSLSDIQRIHHALVYAVKVGRISEQRLNQAVERILNLKKRYLSISQTKKLSIQQHVTTLDHQKIAQCIASTALQITSGDPTCLNSVHHKQLVVLAPQLLAQNIKNASLLELSQKTQSWFYDLAPSYHDISAAQYLTEQADLALIFCYNAWKYEAQAALIQAVLDLGKPVILVSTRDPIDSSLFPHTYLTLTTFSPSLFSMQAVYKLLAGECK